MPYTHHSHSGQFCAHARDTLAEMYTSACKKRMRLFATTEHVPRPNPLDMYSEETAAGIDPAAQSLQFESYIHAATRLRKEADAASTLAEDHKHVPHVIVGFETEWIRPDESAAVVGELLTREGVFDFYVGSVHHVKTHPIDFDRDSYEQAREACGGTEEELFLAYYEAQHDMLTTLKPPVVGHFDLIRLLSDDPGQQMRGWGSGKVWRQICRNLEVVADYGGLLEINSAALRKGLSEPYPTSEICSAWMDLRGGGDFVLSDDSHGIEQVAVCYRQVQDFLCGIGLATIVHLARENGRTVKKRVLLDTVWEPFWNAQAQVEI